MRKLFLKVRENTGVLFVFIAATVVSIVLIVVGNLPNSPTLLGDLGLNIISEIFGIFLTVAIIEKLLRDSEERKRLPLKNHSYARLMDLVISLMFYMTLPGKRTIIEIVFFYGDSFSSATYDNEIETENRRESLPALINFYRQKVNEYIDLYGYLLEPDLLILLQNLKLKIDEMSSKKPGTDEKTWTLYQFFAQGIALNAVEIYKYLGDRSSRQIPISELVNEMAVKVKEAAESLRAKAGNEHEGNSNSRN